MDSLKGVGKRRTVLLVENIGPYLHHVIGAYAEDIVVESTMMDGAHCHSIRNDWLTTVRVFSEVCRIEKLWMPKSTECALGVVGDEDALAEDRLVESTSNSRLGVLAAE